MEQPYKTLRAIPGVLHGVLVTQTWDRYDCTKESAEQIYHDVAWDGQFQLLGESEVAECYSWRGE